MERAEAVFAHSQRKEGLVKTKPLSILVAMGRIAPPTRGFSTVKIIIYIVF